MPPRQPTTAPRRETNMGAAAQLLLNWRIPVHFGSPTLMVILAGVAMENISSQRHTVEATAMGVVPPSTLRRPKALPRHVARERRARDAAMAMKQGQTKMKRDLRWFSMMDQQWWKGLCICTVIHLTTLFPDFISRPRNWIVGGARTMGTAKV